MLDRLAHALQVPAQLIPDVQPHLKPQTLLLSTFALLLLCLETRRLQRLRLRVHQLAISTALRTIAWST